MQAQQTEYMEAIVFNFPGAVVRVQRPILTEEERARRMQQIHRAAANLMKAVKR